MIVDAYRSLGETPWVKAEERDLLRDMDDAGIDVSVVAPMGRMMVLEYAEGNRRVVGMQRRWPDRVLGFGTVNPWAGQEAVEEEIKKIAGEGLCGIAINPAVQGVAAHSPMMGPVMENAIRHRLPVYIHSGTPSFGLPLQITYLAELYPEATLVMGHMGGADFYIDIQLAMKHAPHIYLETSLTCHVAYVEEGWRGAQRDHVLFGSDYPFSNTKAEMLKVRQTTIDEAEKRRIFGANAAALFGLKGGR